MPPNEAKHNLNVQQWIGIIHARNDSGLSVKDYCNKNNLSRNAYFYWRRIIRQEMLDQSESNTASIVEINMPAIANAPVSVPINGSIKRNGGLELSFNGITLYITDNTSSELITRTLG